MESRWVSQAAQQELSDKGWSVGVEGHLEPAPNLCEAQSQASCSECPEMHITQRTEFSHFIFPQLLHTRSLEKASPDRGEETLIAFSCYPSFNPSGMEKHNLTQHAKFSENVVKETKPEYCMNSLCLIVNVLKGTAVCVG